MVGSMRTLETTAEAADFSLDSQGIDVTMTLTLDNYPARPHGTLVDADGNTVLSGGPYAGRVTLVETRVCRRRVLHAERVDSFGDGMCCAYGTGGYEFWIGGLVLASGGDFGSVSRRMSA